MTDQTNKPKRPKDKNRNNSFYSTIIANRAGRELEKREQEFAEAHCADTDRELISYVCQQALMLRHSPREKEITGWKYLLERFGSWEKVLERARLNPYTVEESERDYAIVREERDRQIELHKERKRKRKIKAAQRLKQQEQKRKEQELWLAEHPEQARKKKKKKKINNSSDKKQV